MAERFLVKDLCVPEGVKLLPENLKKKIARNEKLAGQKKKELVQIRKIRKETRHGLKMNAQKYEKEYAQAAKTLVQLRRTAKANGQFFVEPEAKLIFCMRITGVNKLAPKPRKILQLLRLRQLHNGVFLKVNVPIINMLRYIAPYVTFGYPNLKTVKELMYKRAAGRVTGRLGTAKQIIPLNNNEVIQGELGKFGINGMEDLIHEIYTVGPHFKQANRFLATFKLRAPRGGFVNKRHGYHEPKGGDWGNRQEEINELIRRMN